MNDGRASPAPSVTPTSRIVVQPLRQREAPVFHGYPDEDPDDWLRAYERTAKYNQWDDVAKLVNVVFSLACAAFIWFENHERELDSWDSFKSLFREAFSVASRARAAEMQLRHRRQRPGEHVRDYYEDILRLCARADTTMTDDRKLEHLMRGVRDEFFAPLTSTPPTSPVGFFSVCSRVEKQLELRRLGDGRAPSLREIDAFQTSDLQTMVRQLIKNELANLRNEIVATIRNELCCVSSATTMMGSRIASCTSNEETPRQINHSDLQTVVHNEVLAALGQTRRPTPPPPVSHQPGLSSRRTDQWRTTDNTPICFYCGRAGHVQRYCRLRQSPSNRPTSRRSSPTRQQSPSQQWVPQQHHQPSSAPRYQYDQRDFPSLPARLGPRSRTPSPPNDDRLSVTNSRRRSPSPSAFRRRSPSPAARDSRRDTLN